jgi:VWFA-related protein
MKLLSILGCFAVSLAWAQTAPTPPAPAPSTLPPPISSNTPEMNTRQDSTATFQSHVNLVLVPVVARDAHGAVVGNLTKENFTLYDKGKLQVITRFAMEKVGSKSLEADATPVDATPAQGAPNSLEGEKSTVVVPERFVAYLFDDVHINVTDIQRLREAALRQIATMKPSDRAAIYTMSGFPQVDFTDDQGRLKDAILRLRPNIQAAVGAMAGGQGPQGEIATLASLDVIKQVIKRMAGAPGQRIVVMVSPGFFTINPIYFPDKQDILDQAVRYNVIINGLDARGLWTDPTFDASRQGTTGGTGGAGGGGGRGGGGGGRGGRLGLNAVTRESMRSDILAELASGTGGSFFQNSNDYDEGFRRLGSAPEYVYMLGFTPQNLKNDGSFHALRVVVKPSNSLNIQARRGYYAPGKKEDAEETAKEEIGNALFSREELHELPIELHTRFFKPEGNTAKMTVILRLDLRLFKFNQAYGRNNNNVTMVTGIFDRDGNYLQGIKKVLELHLKDETLAVKLARGAVIRTDFDLMPGTYLVRQVVRDTEGQQMSATNAAVVIP